MSTADIAAGDDAFGAGSSFLRSRPISKSTHRGAAKDEMEALSGYAGRRKSESPSLPGTSAVVVLEDVIFLKR